MCSGTGVNNGCTLKPKAEGMMQYWKQHQEQTQSNVSFDVQRPR